MQRTACNSILSADDALELFMAVARCHSALRQQMRSTARSCELTLTGSLLLLVCHRSPDQNQRQLADWLAISPANVCAEVERLKQAGLTVASRSDDDRRCQTWRLSPEGIQRAHELTVNFESAAREFAPELEAFLADLMALQPDAELTIQQKGEAA